MIMTALSKIKLPRQLVDLAVFILWLPEVTPRESKTQTSGSDQFPFKEKHSRTNIHGNHWDSPTRLFRHSRIQLFGENCKQHFPIPPLKTDYLLTTDSNRFKM